MNIDYTKLNDQIVKQATEISGFTLSEDQKKKLFSNKIERAAAMLEAQKKSPAFHTSA